MDRDIVQPYKLHEQVVDRLRAQIVSGELHPGDQLPNERKLAEHYGVSRTVIREAMKTLVQNGLVEIRPGLGTFVVDGTSRALKQSLRLMLSFDQTGRLADMVEIREILEPEIAALAAVRAVERDIEVMDRAVANMDENMADVKSFIRADHEFHLALALATQNISIPKLLDPIVDLLHELRGHIFQVEGAPERGQQHHKRILEAIRRRDPVSAREAMRAHLSQVRDDTDTASVGG